MFGLFREKNNIREPKRFIKTGVRVHDQTQIEIAFDYRILFGTKEELISRKINYTVEAYFFMPLAFGMNADTYPKESFYADLRPLIRFKEPKMGYFQIVGLKDPEKSPIKILQSVLNKSAKDLTEMDIKYACDEVRIFGCVFVRYFWKRAEKYFKKIEVIFADKSISEDERGKKLQTAAASCRHLLVRIEFILQEFYKIIDRLDKFDNPIWKDLKREVHRIDEMVLYNQMDMLVYLLKNIDASSCKANQNIESLKNDTQKFARNLRSKIIDVGYLYVDHESDDQEKEAYVLRRKFLKAHSWEVFHLKMRKKPVFAFQRQIGAMIAAGLAATWAVAIQIMVISEVTNAESINSIFGISGAVFLSAAIGGYIIKDRIKEAGRSYFRSGVFRKLSDNSESLTYESSRILAKPIEIGNYSETTTINTEKSLPERVQRLREVYSDLGVSDQISHKVICYRRDVSIKDKILKANSHPLKTVHDILRFNISGFLGRLADPTQVTSCLDANGDLQSITLPKIYHLDVVLRHRKFEKKKVDNKEGFEYIRLYIDKNGLIKVKKLT